jgi:cyclase
MSLHHIPEREIAERPAGYLGPNLSPAGLELVPHRLSEGVYALLANVVPKDNNGVIFGRDAALVVDAGITPEVSRRIQDLARGLTDAPLRYLANTTYHGDHTFGNAAFPDNVTVISSRVNKENMADLAYEKAQRSANMYGDEKLLDDVTHWRTPDVVFDSYAEVDLGGRVVELWHFGPGNGPGDTIVYVPDARTAWTGNFLCHAGIAHMLLQGGPEPYLDSLHRMRKALPDLKTVVPGHGPMGSGPDAIGWLSDYLGNLRDNVGRLHGAGHSLAETLELCPSPFADGLDPRLSSALREYYGPQEAILSGSLDLSRNLHQLNVLATYRIFEAATDRDQTPCG